jgi:hypothetical protein
MNWTLQRKIGIAITIFSVFTIFINALHWQPEHPDHSLLGLMFGILGVILFGASIFHESIVYKIVQVVLMALTSILTLTLNDQALYIAMGVFFVFGTISTMWAYDFFERRPLFIILITVSIFFGLFCALTREVVTSSAMTFGLGIACYLVWVPLHDKIKRLIKIARQAMRFADEATAELKERVTNGKTKR